MQPLAQFSILVYAALVLAGGVIGCVKGKSLFSLLVGVITSFLLIVANSMVEVDPRNGFLFAAGIASVLTIIFVLRLVKTKKFMPSGLLLVISMFEELFLLLATFIRF